MYDPKQLRTFLAVAETLSFTEASRHLGLSQPTVSQHVRKLEDSIGRPVLVRDTHAVTLTADGEALVGFARTIVAAHEQAVAHFTGSGLSGRLRFGVTDDLALTPLPRVLRDFRTLYPRINLELTVAQSVHLARRIELGHLDVALVKHPAGQRGGRLVRRDRHVWASVDGAPPERGQPVPLVVYQAPSLTRSIGVEALERVGRDYRITCTVRGVNGVLAAVRAGLGIATFAHSLVPDDIKEIPSGSGLPRLRDIDLVLLTNPRAPRDSVEALTAAIVGRIATASKLSSDGVPRAR